MGSPSSFKPYYLQKEVISPKKTFWKAWSFRLIQVPEDFAYYFCRLEPQDLIKLTVITDTSETGRLTCTNAPCWDNFSSSCPVRWSFYFLSNSRVNLNQLFVRSYGDCVKIFHRGLLASIRASFNEKENDLPLLCIRSTKKHIKNYVCPSSSILFDRKLTCTQF